MSIVAAPEPTAASQATANLAGASNHVPAPELLVATAPQPWPYRRGVSPRRGRRPGRPARAALAVGGRGAAEDAPRAAARVDRRPRHEGRVRGDDLRFPLRPLPLVPADQVLIVLLRLAFGVHGIRERPTAPLRPTAVH